MAGEIPQLNAEQRRAASELWQTDIPALQIIAGAGSGKTSTLTAAVAEAVAHGYSSQRIAALTFSRRAATELRERLAAAGIRIGFCGTMHALAWKLLRAGKKPPRLVLHSQTKRVTLARALFPAYAHIPDRIFLKTGFLSSEERAALEDRYRTQLSAAGETDFDAMISEATGLGKDLFDVVFVDEFQDTSPDQFLFVQSLSARKYFVVGDDWQSIYRFRGADVSLTRNFTQLMPGARRVYLVSNYRSGRTIVKLGNRIIRQSSAFVTKKLRATRSSAVKNFLLHTVAEGATAAWQKLERAIASGKLPATLADFFKHRVTILVRTNAVRRLLEKQLPANFEILTIHKSKGLEFDNVLVFGIAKNMMPHRDNDFDEEVRILYVALTRARHCVGFVGWENGSSRSAFLEPLIRNCRLVYF